MLPGRDAESRKRFFKTRYAFNALLIVMLIISYPLIRRGFERSKDEEILVQRLEEASWEQIAPPGTGLTFELPGEIEQDATEDAGVARTLSTGEVSDNLFFSVSTARGDAIDDSLRAIVLRREVDSAASIIGGEVIRARWVQLDGVEALEFLIHAGDALESPDEANKTRIAGYATELDDHLVLIQAFSTVDAPPGLDRVRDSLQQVE